MRFKKPMNNNYSLPRFGHEFWICVVKCQVALFPTVKSIRTDLYNN